MRQSARSRREARRNPLAATAALGGLACLLAASAGAGKGDQLPTTSEDYFQKGTQPLNVGGPSWQPILDSTECAFCHAGFGSEDPFLASEPYGTWISSVMAQSARDPLFYAGLTIANQDAAGGGEYCIRCHVPNAYLGGRANPADGSAFEPVDFQGVACNLCHRAVDPVYQTGVSPAEDEQILSDLAVSDLIPFEGSNSRYIIDPIDVRRGPFSDIPANVHPGIPQPQILPSPYHTHSEFCWQCHDVSNPLLMRQPDGSYVLPDTGSPHPTGKQIDMMPLHRTYSEWKNSYYSSIGVQHNGRFGGNHPTGVMKVCQDCHMPDQEGYGCNVKGQGFFERPNVPQHSFLGANTWVVNAVRTVDVDGDSVPDFPDNETGLTDTNVDAAYSRNADFLAKASDLHIEQFGQQLRVRISNKGGHKLPTGFPDGRHIWINVKFLGCQGETVLEHGAYDFDTATLDASTTKVYEMKLGIAGAEYAAQVGKPEGPTFHFLLANEVLKDNRIPPAGYSPIIAQSNQTKPVGAFYGNGQHWDDTFFDVPSHAHNAVVTVYYQLASREFMEFLRDANTTDNRGQAAYDEWVNHGMSAPIVMDMAQLAVFPATDVNQDGSVDFDDVLDVIAAWNGCPDPPASCPQDVNMDGLINFDDVLAIIFAWDPC